MLLWRVRDRCSPLWGETSIDVSPQLLAKGRRRDEPSVSALREFGKVIKRLSKIRLSPTSSPSDSRRRERPMRTLTEDIRSAECRAT